MEMIPQYPDCKDSDSFKSGIEYQDFVCLQLSKQNIIVQNIGSKYFQFNIGENLQGIEIKLDRRFTETKRLSIETHEKALAENEKWIESGILREDNSWLYIQGNYEYFYIFAKRILVLLYHSGRYEIGSIPTLKKFYLPIEDADKYCAKKIITPE